jgi:hypothetical protein
MVILSGSLLIFRKLCCFRLDCCQWATVGVAWLLSPPRAPRRVEIISVGVRVDMSSCVCNCAPFPRVLHPRSDGCCWQQLKRHCDGADRAVGSSKLSARELQCLMQAAESFRIKVVMFHIFDDDRHI